MGKHLPPVLVPRAQLAATLLGARLRPSQRLRAQGILALTAQLVRAAQEGRMEALEAGMAERHRLLAALRSGIVDDGEVSCVEAAAEAVVESDRTLLMLRAMQ